MTYCWQKISFYCQTCPTDRNWTTKQKLTLLEWQSARLASLIPCAVWKKIFLSYNHTPSANWKLLLFIFFLTPGFWNPRTCNQNDTECETQESYISIQWSVPETNQTTASCSKKYSEKLFHRITLLCQIESYLFLLLAKIATAQKTKKNKSPIFINYLHIYQSLFLIIKTNSKLTPTIYTDQ